MDVLLAALYFLDKYPNFEDALQFSLQFAGSANYCPVLVGSIGGARYGVEHIPKHHLKDVGDALLQRISLVADEFKKDWKEI